MGVTSSKAVHGTIFLLLAICRILWQMFETIAQSISSLKLWLFQILDDISWVCLKNLRNKLYIFNWWNFCCNVKSAAISINKFRIRFICIFVLFVAMLPGWYTLHRLSRHVCDALCWWHCAFLARHYTAAYMYNWNMNTCEHYCLHVTATLSYTRPCSLDMNRHNDYL